MPIVENFDAGLEHVLIAYESDDGNLYQISCREGWSDLLACVPGVDPRTLPPLPKGTKVRVGHWFSVDTSDTPHKYKRRNYVLASKAQVQVFAAGGALLNSPVKDGFQWNSLGWTGEKRRKLD